MKSDPHKRAKLQHMGVDHCGFYIAMTEQFLNRADLLSEAPPIAGSPSGAGGAACVWRAVRRRVGPATGPALRWPR